MSPPNADQAFDPRSVVSSLLNQPQAKLNTLTEIQHFTPSGLWQRKMFELPASSVTLMERYVFTKSFAGHQPTFSKDIPSAQSRSDGNNMPSVSERNRQSPVVRIQCCGSNPCRWVAKPFESWRDRQSVRGVEVSQKQAWF